jgi:hypothetical protein
MIKNGTANAISTPVIAGTTLIIRQEAGFPMTLQETAAPP